jgi:hypothetical protein
MAFMNKERKNERAPAIRKILKEYGQKGTLSVRNYSKLVLKIRDVANMFEDKFAEASDYAKEYGISVNPYQFERHYENNPKAVEMLEKLTAAMYGEDYFNDTDAMIDYFHCSHYIAIEILPPITK